jgi:arylsulfatase
MAGYPKVFNIEMDPHEDLNLGGPFGWTGEQPLMAVRKYFETLKQHPNPTAPDITVFRNPTG